MDEFLRELIPEPHLLEPVDELEVERRQPRPSQRRQIDEQEDYEAGGTADSFLKKQADGKVANPRPITTMNPKDKLSLAPYVYALDPLLHEAPWYGPGKTPLELADRVTEICTYSTTGIQQGDCRALDSTMNAIPEELMRRMFARAFNPRYHVEMYNAIKNNRNKTVIARFGTRFESWLETCSGAMWTSMRNTVTVGAASYYGYRRMGRSAGVAYKCLGTVTGDDTFHGDMDGKCLEQAFKAWGLIMLSTFIPRGAEGVEYLARRYGPDVWFGDNNSTCDIKRQASKFHLTVCLPSNVTRERKLVDKAYAFWLSDARTPIIGDFVCRVKELFPELWPDDESKWGNVTNQYMCSTAANAQYPNNVDLFGMDIVETQLPEFDYQTFRVSLAGTSRESIFVLPICDGGRNDPTPESGDVVVDGDLLHGKPEQPVEAVKEKLVLPDHIDTPLVTVEAPTKTEKSQSRKYRKRKPRAKRDQAKPKEMRKPKPKTKKN